MILLKKNTKNFNLNIFLNFLSSKWKNNYLALLILVFLSFLPAIKIKYSSFPSSINSVLIKIFGKNNFLIGHLNYESSFYGNAYRFIKARTLPEDKLYLSLNFKAMSHLQKERDQTLINGYINPFLRKEVSGKIKYKNKSIPVKVRLKGDSIDHLENNKWSMRVKGKNGLTILGLREFSLQQPSTRNYFGELLYHLLLQSEGLPSLRYKFKTLIFNGKNLGTYAIEEHFDKRLLENNNYREGPIIKLSEKNMFIEYDKRYKIFKKWLPTKEYQYGEKFSEVIPFNKNKLSRDKLKFNQFLRARNLLHMFLLGERKIEDTFDIELTAKYFALNDLLFVSHANAWNNIRFYFNPITAKLIPIGYDADVPIKMSSNSYPELSIDRNLFNFFDSQVFVKQYITFLEKYSDQEFLEDFLLRNNEKIQKNLLKIQRSYPFVRLLKNELIKNQNYLRVRLNPSEPIIVRIKENKNNKIKISVANRYNLPIELHSIYKDGYIYNNDERIILQKNNSKRFEYKSFNFERSNIAQDQFKTNYLLLKYKILGSKNFLTKKINLQNLDDLDNAKLDSEINIIKNNFKDIKYFDIDQANKKIFIKQGSWKIDRPIILPKGYSLLANEGTELEFINKSYINVSGKITFIGTKKNPIKLKSKDQSGSIIIRNAKEVSTFKNVIFSNLKLEDFPYLGLTGNITFYNSPVEISDSAFINLYGEDSLNVIGSTLILENSYFSGSFSDALDLDFVKAKIENVYFENVGNDAIDISGSEVKAKNIFISGAQDKGISVGEKSNLFLSGIKISSSNIAFASKDLSLMILEKVDLKNNDLCFTAYKKKDEYGPGIIKILDNSVNDETLKFECKKSHLLESESEIKNKDNSFEINTLKVYDQLYGNKYGKETIR
tara:strand:- start:1774 stop:4443 length:2670 start_codon:yes stop_codon:yes gene_type:complete